MRVSGGAELGYASVAVLTELRQHLTEINVITPHAAGDLLTKATISLQGLGNRLSAVAAINVIGEMRGDLAKKGIV